MKKAKTPQEIDKSYKRSFNIKAGLATFLLYCNLSMQSYHDDIKEDLQKDPEGTCANYYDKNYEKQLKDQNGKSFENKSDYVDSCTKSINSMPEKSTLSSFFGQLSFGMAGLSLFSLMGWRDHRKKHPELSNSPDNE